MRSWCKLVARLPLAPEVVWALALSDLGGLGVHAVARIAQDLRAFANDAEGFSGADLASLAR